MVRGLDEDETNFLDEVSRQQELIEKQRREEELKELKEHRSNLNKVGISSENKKEVEKKAVKPIETKNKFSQAKLLAGAVKHKRSACIHTTLISLWLCAPRCQSNGSQNRVT